METLMFLAVWIGLILPMSALLAGGAAPDGTTMRRAVPSHAPCEGLRGRQG
jgi:hypothetical protein